MHNLDQRPLDEKGKAHGEWLYYYENGLLNYRYNYFHGIPHGLNEGYHSDGSLWYRGHMNMGGEIGYWYYDYQPKEYYLWLI